MSEGGRTLQLGGRVFDEARLIRDLRKKDPEATRRLIRQLIDDNQTRASTGLEVIVKAFGPELHAFIVRLLGPESDNAHEIYADWLERVLVRCPSYDSSQSAFRTWLYQQAKYATVDWRRRQSHLPEPVDSDSIEAPLDSASDQPPDVLALGEKRALQRALQRLRPAERELLWWRYVEGWTPVEIARAKLAGSVPDHHVKVYVARAVSKLAAFYDDESKE
jgi:RNA polymerase sigma factor (sigma-70 family)